MNFKDWQINVLFYEVRFPTEYDEREDRTLMEESIALLINGCDYMPKEGELVGDINAKDEPFRIKDIVFHPRLKIIEFVLTFDD